METNAGETNAAPARPDDEAATGETGETAGEVRKPGRRRSAAPDAERGGPTGPEPTRYGDWERQGIARDF